MMRDPFVSLDPWLNGRADAVPGNLEPLVVGYDAADNAAAHFQLTLDAPESPGLTGLLRLPCYQARPVEALVPKLADVSPVCALVRSCRERTVSYPEALMSRGKEGGHRSTVNVGR